jgi:putative ABC transport system permease protein
MKILNLLIIAIRSLNKNKVRSLLTMLGIIIGVASVIAMLAIGQGSRDAIQKQIAGMGTNVIMIFPGASFRGGVATAAGTAITLRIEDVDAIRAQCPAVKYLSPVARAGGQVIASNNNWNTTVNGVYAEYLDIRNLELESGSRFTDDDEKRASKVCIIGKTVSDNLFGEDSNPIGQKIRIRNIPFTIIGLLKQKGQSGMGQDQDDIIYAPYSTIQKRMRGSSNEVQQVYISAISEADIPVAQQQIDELLRTRKNLSLSEEPPYNIRTQTEITQTATATSSTMITLLASIASISLLVGGIGIMNIMLVSVTERTREIGLRMAIGARGRDILRQFLLEAMLLSILGGLIGIALGVGTSKALVQFLGWPVTLTSYSIILAFSFATIIGVFFGWYPARKASNLIPMDALRYE